MGNLSGFKRRAPTVEERTTPCHACSFPLSHRHHALPFAEHGETPITYPLCPNCHELLHLAIRVIKTPTKRNTALWTGVVKFLGETHVAIRIIIPMAYEHTQFHEDIFFEQLEEIYPDNEDEEMVWTPDE